MSPTRRQAMMALLALPLGTRLAAQVRPGPRHRVILGNGEGLLLDPDGTLRMWVRHPVSDGTAPDSLGLGHNGPLQPFTLATVPGLTNVVAASAGWNCTFAVLSDGRLLAWGVNSNGRRARLPRPRWRRSRRGRPTGRTGRCRCRRDSTP